PRTGRARGGLGAGPPPDTSVDARAAARLPAEPPGDDDPRARLSRAQPSVRAARVRGAAGDRAGRGPVREGPRAPARRGPGRLAGVWVDAPAARLRRSGAAVPDPLAGGPPRSGRHPEEGRRRGTRRVAGARRVLPPV